MTTIDILETLKSTNALLEGHFLYASGRHGAMYIEKFNLRRNPEATSEACRGFADRFREERVDVVVGPTTGGILLAFEIARQLGISSAYAERASEGASGREIRRNTTFKPGSRVLVVDDIMTTGGSIRETLTALEAHPVEIVAVAVLVDRSGGTITFGDVPVFALASQTFESWAADDLPEWLAAIPITRPGTTSVV
ncbi:MAG: orotate phosphoribosyltransferase [Thermomicrobiales bacterium]